MRRSSARAIAISLLLFPFALDAAPAPPPSPTVSASTPPPPHPPPPHPRALQPPGAASPVVPGKGCARVGCHAGLMHFVDPKTGMGHALARRAKRAGDAEGCTPCHGGKPDAPTKEAAHGGASAALIALRGPDTFYPDPGSPWINARSCGACHKEQVFGQKNSLMMTEAGKIQGAYWAFGSKLGYQHKYANYATKNPPDPAARLGSPAYQAYMAKLQTLEPQLFPDKMEALPRLPSTDAVTKNPKLAKLTYLRSECLRCHVGVRGRQKRGDYRGMGCSACHVPYGNEGLYEGKDPSISKTKKGHLLVHRLQATRKHKVTIHGKTYSGIPVETCTTCHDRGKRVGVSFQGLMESAFSSPHANGGKRQPKLHTKHYLAMYQDIHYQKGMMCLDCHTSIDVHGDGFLFGANLAQVQIECTDCHGTPGKYPWELPLGYGEEHEGRNARGTPRGITRELPARLKRATVYPAEDGYILTARGNPFRNVIRRGNTIVVHTAGGKDLLLSPLKTKTEANALKLDAKVAMVGVGRHIDKMECYSCHATWAPQCYGCHVKVDYSKKKRAFDWVAAGRRRQVRAQRAESREDPQATSVAGEVQEGRSYMRWENPMMVQDGEGRVSPAIPGCQVNATIIGPSGEVLTQNKIFHSPAGTEGGGPKGQLAIDMSPVQPHTIGHARSCESCHASAKALGYGIGGGKLNRPWNKSLTVDLSTADQKVLPRQTRVQIGAIAGLKNDWSRIVDEKGHQQMTVGHHFKHSRPLDQAQRQRMDRRGVCLSCHKEIPRESLAINLLHHVAKTMKMLPRERQAHASLLTKILLLSAWGQVLGILLGGVLFLGGAFWLVRRRRRRRRDKTQEPRDP